MILLGIGQRFGIFPVLATAKASDVSTCLVAICDCRRTIALYGFDTVRSQRVGLVRDPNSCYCDQHWCISIWSDESREYDGSIVVYRYIERHRIRHQTICSLCLSP